MLVVILILGISSGALIIGALWGSRWGMSRRVEGFMIALAGGALIYAAMDQMITPALHHAPVWAVVLAIGSGALLFTIADRWVEQRTDGGEGLALAVTVDGVPENLALGTALIASSPSEVAALAAAILLSNLPESAGGAKIMHRHNVPQRKILLLWSAVAVLLTLSGLTGYVMFQNLPPFPLAMIHGFAAGAVLSSLATEVFPAAYRDNAHDAGIAVAIGVILALVLGHLG